MTIVNRLDESASLIIKAYEEGQSTCSLGKEFNCNAGTIWYWLKKRGIETRKMSENYGNSERYHKDVRRLHTQGMSAYKIGQALGIGKSLVLLIFRRIGLSTSHKSTKRDDPLLNHRDDIIASYEAGASTCSLALLYGASSSAIWRLLTDSGVECRDRAIYTSDETFFDRIDTEEKAYILGWFASDGNNKKNNEGVRLSICDLPILERIRDEMEYTGPIYYKKPQSDRHQASHELSIHSKRLSIALSKCGCPPAKTLILTFPSIDILPIALQRHFVRGFLDGDGCIGCFGKARRWAISITSTKEMLTGIAEVAGVHLSLCQRHPERNKNNWTMQVYRIGDIRKFLDWIYTDSTIHLDRKHAKYLQFLERYGVTAEPRRDISETHEIPPTIAV